MGALAALSTAVLIPIQVAVFVIWPPPSTVAGWFSLFHTNPVRGLLDMDLLLICDVILLVPILLSLYVRLRAVSPSWMTLGTGFGLVSIATYFASNPAFEMLSLSNEYASATTDSQRTAYLAVGQALLASYSTGTAFYAYYVLGAVALIAISAVMLQSPEFSRFTGWTGIVANAVSLGLFIPVVGIALSVVSVFGLEVWYVLIGRNLLRAPEPRVGSRGESADRVPGGPS